MTPTAALISQFNEANNNALGTGWTEGDILGISGTTLQINSNSVNNGSGATSVARRSTTYGPDSEFYMDIPTLPGNGEWIGFFVRCTPTTNTNGYVVEIYNDGGSQDIYIFRVTSNSYTQLGAALTNAAQAGDSLMIQAVGSSINIERQRSGTWSVIATRTDSTYNSAGNIGFYGNGTTFRLDNAGGGDYIEPSGGTEYTQSVSGTVTGGGAVIKRTNKPLAGTTSATGALVKRLARTLGGSVSWVGSLSSALNLIAQYALEFYGDDDGQNYNSMSILLEDGVDPYPINMAGDQTIEMKFRALAADNTATAADARYSHPLTDWDSWDDTWGRVLGLSRSGANLVLCFGVAGVSGTWATIYGTTNVGDGEWHDVALTYNRTTGAVVIWLDGVQEASGTFDAQDWDYPAGYVNPDGSYNNRAVFMREKHGVGELTVGALDEIRFSNIIRYTSSYTPAARFDIDANTTGLYHLDEGSGTTSVDATGNNPDAVLHVGGTPEGPVWISTATVFTQVLTATVSAAGAVAKQTQRAIAATTSGAGALVKQAARTLSGSLSGAGLLTSVRVYVLALAGSMSGAGTLARETRKTFIGSSSAAGTLARATARTVSGTVTAGGTVVKQAQRAVSGTVTSGGAVIKQTQRTMAAAASAAGALVKQAARTLGGSLTGAGLLDASLNAGAFFVELMGGVTGTGALGRQTQRTINGTASGAGSVSRQIGRGLAGSMTGAGALSASRLYTVIVAGAASAAGTLTRQTNKALAGVMSGAGTINRQVRRLLAGASSLIGALVTTFGGAIQPGKANVSDRATGTTTTRDAALYQASAHDSMEE